MSFNVKNFYKFCAALSVETKERGMMTLAKEKLLGTQTYVINEIARGLEDDVHFFVTLKGRQLGITTISLAFDLYWLFTNEGIQGSLVTDTDENREMFRTTLGMYVEGLPNQFKIPVKGHTEKQLVLKNRSRFLYQVAGTRRKAGLGRGKAITFLHGTETSSWGDENGLKALLASLSQINPMRFYHFESTANGPNLFEEMYRTAKASSSQRAIFCGWWRNHFYRIERDDARYDLYWDGELKTEEKAWVKDIQALYGVEIEPEQIAWWRWYLEETNKGDELMMFQEFPPTEDYAFVLTGMAFFQTLKIRDEEKRAKQLEPQVYRYVFGAEWYETEAVLSNDHLADLTVWEEPQPNGVYVIGAHPAFSSSDTTPEYVVEVYRCYSDCIEQVAEYVTLQCNTDQFAWVVAHLAGAYGNATVNMEMNASGQSVENEFKTLRRKAAVLAGRRGSDLMNVLGAMSSYLWRRNDLFTGGGNSKGWVTSHSSYERMLAYFKAAHDREQILIRSPMLLYEMKKFTRSDDGIKGRGDAGEGRVVTTAFACAAYAEQVRGRLIDLKLSKAVSQSKQPETPMGMTATRNVASYLKRIGLYDARNS